jgi:hypothetical protein
MIPKDQWQPLSCSKASWAQEGQHQKKSMAAFKGTKASWAQEGQHQKQINGSL